MKPMVERSGHTLTVTAGSSPSLSLTLVGGSYEIDGFAKRAGKPIPGTMVFLVPKDRFEKVKAKPGFFAAKRGRFFGNTMRGGSCVANHPPTLSPGTPTSPAASGSR